jgi:hypothetical protein
LRADEVGVKVATVFASFMTTVPGTSFPVVSLTANVSKSPAEEELTVAGSIGWLKVAVTTVPVTTLLLLFVLVGTDVALLLGLDEITVGSVAAPTRVPGATVTPGSTAAKTLPIPPPASKAANSKAINIGGLYELSNLVIFFPYFHEIDGVPVYSPEGGMSILRALNENLDKWAYYAAFWRTRDSVLVAAKRCAFSSR